MKIVMEIFNIVTSNQTFSKLAFEAGITVPFPASKSKSLVIFYRIQLI